MSVRLSDGLGWVGIVILQVICGGAFIVSLIMHSGVWVFASIVIALISTVVCVFTAFVFAMAKRDGSVVVVMILAIMDCAVALFPLLEVLFKAAQ